MYLSSRRAESSSTLKGQCQNLTSGQGYVRSRVEPNRSCRISVDVSMAREAHWDYHLCSIYILSKVSGNKLNLVIGMTSNVPNETSSGQNCV